MHELHLRKEKLLLDKLHSLDLFRELKVMYGPFEGLMYPSLKAAGSGIFPKLIGSYEAELHGYIEMLLRERYDLVIDIGSAEGYYAAGISRRMPGTPVYAFDTDASARELCAELCKLNDVSSSVNIKAECTPSHLVELLKNQRALVISDCEGYEDVLFTSNTINAFRNTDLIIETHDVLKLGISDRIKAIFKQSHEVVVVGSISNEKKASIYDYIRNDILTYEEKLVLYSERPYYMEWLICITKNSVV
jgi:hypothetical protein